MEIAKEKRNERISVILELNKPLLMFYFPSSTVLGRPSQHLGGMYMNRDPRELATSKRLLHNSFTCSTTSINSYFILASLVLLPCPHTVACLSIELLHFLYPGVRHMYNRNGLRFMRRSSTMQFHTFDFLFSSTCRRVLSALVSSWSARPIIISSLPPPTT